MSYKKAMVVIPLYYNHSMTKTIKPDVAPGEFKCKVCEMMWSTFMENNIPCTDTTILRNGLHDFDFANRIVLLAK